jgi:hypothetical protein
MRYVLQALVEASWHLPAMGVLATDVRAGTALAVVCCASSECDVTNGQWPVQTGLIRAHLATGPCVSDHGCMCEVVHTTCARLYRQLGEYYI